MGRIISLIPKVDVLKFVTKFRPISLCNVLYKLVAKCITNRMKSVPYDVISDSQSDFILGHLISDNYIVAFETIHAMKRCLKEKVVNIVIKLDICKARDRIEWGFLEALLEMLGFNDHWVALLIN